jgi:hypothetical protein
MTLFAFASTRGSPGVTATLLGLAAGWQEATGRRVLVVEADPDGGALAGRFEELRADRTLADVVVDIRRRFDLDAVWASTQRLWEGVPVVVAPPSAEQAHSALTAGGDRLAAGLASVEEFDVLVDVGRLTARSPALPLARRAAATIFVTRPSFELVASLAARLPELKAQGCDPSVLLIGDRPYSADDVEQSVGCPVLAVLPEDAKAAAVVAGGAGSDRRLRRSLLWRSYGETASRLLTLAPALIEVDLQPEAPIDGGGDDPVGVDVARVEA